jgi:tetratricopeptide (TPR) repeat protein
MMGSMTETAPGSLRCTATARGARALAMLLLVALACTGDAERRLGEIRELQGAGRFRESIEPLRDFLEGAPEHPAANHLLGVALLETGEPTLAIWPLRKASESDAWAAESGMRLASALLATRNFEEARAALDRVLAREPGRSEAWLLRANADLRLRKPEAALEDVERALALDPEAQGALWLRAGLLARLGRRPEAESAYRALKEQADAAGEKRLAAQSCVAIAGIQLQEDQPERPRQAEPETAVEEPGGLPDPSRVAARLPRLEASPRAEAALRGCVAEFPSEFSVVKALADYLVALGRLDETRDVWQRAVDGSPESLELRLGLANQLWLMDRREEAKQTVRAAAERSDAPRAWAALAELQRLDGEFAAASTSVERALAGSENGEALRYQLASLLLDAGEVEPAEALVESFEEPAYADLLRGRMLLESGEPRAALAALESGLVRWPNNAVARALAGRAAQELGDFERALSEYRESIRADARATEAGLAAARLAYAVGNYADAVTYVGYHVRSHPYTDAEPYRIGVRAAAAAGMESTVEAMLQALARQPDGATQALVERAWLARQAEGSQAAAALIEASGLDLADPAHEPALRALVEAEVAQGRAQQALVRVDGMLAAHPRRAGLLDLRGRLLLELGRTQQARAAFASALAEQADHSGALTGLGVLAYNGGDAAAALRYFEQASAADPSNPESAYRTAQLLLSGGQAAAAERRLRELVLRAPGHAGAANDLAWLLAQRGSDLDFALALSERAVGVAPVPNHWDTLGYVQLQRGDADAAIATLQGALEQHPENATLRYRLGTAFLARGDRAAARAALQAALDAGSFPEADAARSTLASLAGE